MFELNVSVTWALSLAPGHRTHGAFVAACARARSMPRDRAGRLRPCPGPLIAEPMPGTKIRHNRHRGHRRRERLVRFALGWLVGLLTYVFDIAGSIVDFAARYNRRRRVQPRDRLPPGPVARFVAGRSRSLDLARWLDPRSPGAFAASIAPSPRRPDPQAERRAPVRSQSPLHLAPAAGVSWRTARRCGSVHPGDRLRCALALRAPAQHVPRGTAGEVVHPFPGARRVRGHVSCVRRQRSRRCGHDGDVLRLRLPGEPGHRSCSARTVQPDHGQSRRGAEAFVANATDAHKRPPRRRRRATPAKRAYCQIEEMPLTAEFLAVTAAAVSLPAQGPVRDGRADASDLRWHRSLAWHVDWRRDTPTVSTSCSPGCHSCSWAGPAGMVATVARRSEARTQVSEALVEEHVAESGFRSAGAEAGPAGPRPLGRQDRCDRFRGPDRARREKLWEVHWRPASAFRDGGRRRRGAPPTPGAS